MNQELTTKETSREWVENLPEYVKLINKHYSHDPPIVDPLDPKVQPIKVKAYTLASIVLDIGTPVRIQLDHPIDAVGSKRLHGTFRIADVRWENTIRTVNWIYLRPNQPPTYGISGIPDVAYTRNQLQVVQNDEV